MRAAFSLGSQDAGVLVLAVQPDGVADGSDTDPGADAGGGKEEVVE